MGCVGVGEKGNPPARPVEKDVVLANENIGRHEAIDVLLSQVLEAVDRSWDGRH